METVVHGVKIKLHPREKQRVQFDDWRRKARNLWNLLLGMEIAAYSGEKFRPELRWRQIWEECAVEAFQAKADAFANGRVRKDGSMKKLPGIGKAPKPLTPDDIRRIRGLRVDGREPGIFIFDEILMRIMARLKKEPLTAWIGELHSHAGQRVCKELSDALKVMKKLGRGFPRFKKAGYAEGGVYFANTQLVFDWRKRTARGGRNSCKVKFPLGVGWVNCGDLRAEQFKNGAFQGARIFREGDQWWMSAQFKIETPKSGNATDAQCGVKVAASVVYTIEPNGSTSEDDAIKIMPRKYTIRENVLFARSSRRASRKTRRTRSYYEAQAELAKKHAKERNRRDDILHQGSRMIVNRFERIAIDKMKISPLMDKAKSKERREATKKRLAAAGIKMPPIDPKMLRKLNREAAMYKAALFVKYKATEAGRVLDEHDQFKPVTQICASCGKVHLEMKTLKKKMQCGCGNIIDRRVNSSIVIRDDVTPELVG